jgi:NAD(P)H dehydrogenase (quinone)
MPKVLVLYHSAYGPIQEMAEAVAEGARSALARVDVRRVPELVPDEVARKAGYRLDQPHSLARVEDLPRYDAIIVGVGTRFGRMASQMAAFLDQGGAAWASGALAGKVGSAFTSTQHGGQETTLMAIHASLMHFGMVCVGRPYPFDGQLRLDEITGASPYGASTVAGGDGSRRPSADELEGARSQGRHVADIASRLFPSSRQAGEEGLDFVLDAGAGEGFVLAD